VVQELGRTATPPQSATQGLQPSVSPAAEKEAVPPSAAALSVTSVDWQSATFIAPSTGRAVMLR
jgi:hypothetical protein